MIDAIPGLMVLLGFLAMGTIQGWGPALASLVAAGSGAGGNIVRWLGRRPGWTLLVSLPAVPLITSTRTDRIGLVGGIILVHLAPEPGAKAVILGGCLMTLAAEPEVGVPYAVASVLFALLAFTWLALRHRARSSARHDPRRISRRQAAHLGIHLTASLALGTGVALFIPLFQDWLVDLQVGRMSQTSTGFGPVTDLSSVTEIHSSHGMVLRLFARQPRYLRGQVYTRYRKGHWTCSEERRKEPIRPAPGPDPAAGSRSERVGRVERVELLEPESRRLFLPLEAREVVLDDPAMERDQFGIHHLRDGEAEAYAYTAGPLTRTPGSMVPGPQDLEVPDDLVVILRKVAGDFSTGATTPEETADRIQARLTAGYRYSLRPGDPGSKEPLARFLLETREGHCEYFASSMTLMLRVLGVPARYVSGYSVTETALWDDYLVGRNSDAHAWVEVWMPDRGWRTWDPTPPDWRASAGSRASLWFLGLVEALRYRLASFRQRLGSWVAGVLSRGGLPARLAWPMAVVFLIAATCWLLRRLIAPIGAWSRRVRRRGSGEAVHRDQARECLDRIEEVLVREGLVRTRAMTPRELGTRAARSNLPAPVHEALLELIDRICRTCYRGDPWDAGRSRLLAARLGEPVPGRPARDPGTGRPDKSPPPAGNGGPDG